MNRLILIGNGFDLAHGLKTSYHDFILDYLKNSIEEAYRVKFTQTNYEAFDYEDKLIGIKINTEINISYGSPAISQILKPLYDKFFSSTSVQELLSKIVSDVKIDFKQNIFVKSLFNECIVKNWVDIESLYYESLKSLLKAYNKNKEYDGTVSGPLENLRHLNNQLEFIKENLEKYLTGVVSKGDCYIDEYKSIFLSNQLSLGYNLRPKNSLILNFNYTVIPNKYVVDHGFEIINIHGVLNKEINPIIFGYGDEVDKNYKEIEDLNENEFFKHIKSFDYFKTNNYSELLKFIKRDDFEVFVIGHSCGLSDRTMLSTIFNYEKCISIKIFDYRKDKNDYRNKTYEISRHFNNKASMRKKIVSFPECIPMPQHND